MVHVLFWQVLGLLFIQFKLDFSDQESLCGSGSFYSFDSNMISLNKDNSLYDLSPIHQLDGNMSLDSIESSSNVRTRVANFELNIAKQVAGISRDAKARDFTITSNDENRNINIECSSGFYAQVAKPTVYSLAQDHLQSPVNGCQISFDHLTKNLDSSGNEFNLTLFFKLKEKRGRQLNVTVHTHHSTRLIQVQGGKPTLSKESAAQWFVKNILYDKFKFLANAKKLSISRFNEAISSSNKIPNYNKSQCSYCAGDFIHNAKPTLCTTCNKYFHKSSCLKDHNCAVNHEEYPATPDQPESFIALENESDALSSETSSRNTAQISSCSNQSVPSFLAVADASPSLSAHEHLSHLEHNQALNYAVEPNSTTYHALNPYAAQFNPSGSDSRKKRSKQAPPTAKHSPERAEVDSLKIELSYAKTQIAELEAQLRDKDQSLKLYRQKIKLLESERDDLVKGRFSSSGTTASVPKPPPIHNTGACPCVIQLNNLNNIDLKLCEIINILKQPQVSSSLTQRPRNEPEPSSNRNGHSHINLQKASSSVQHGSSHPPIITMFPSSVSASYPNQHDDTAIVEDEITDCSSDGEFEFSSPSRLPNDSPRISLN